MKLFKKLAFLTASVLICCGLGVAAVACGEEEPTSTGSQSTTPSEVEPIDYTYCVRVTNAGGYGFGDVTVKLMDGDDVVAEDKTAPSGRVYFDDIAVDQYDVVLEDLPNGYIPARSYQTIALAGTLVSAEITPVGPLQGEAPAGTRYKLGDVMYDFSIRTSDNTEYTLSQILGEKELLVLNFWATWCGPCKSEFPILNNALIAYADSVECLAISITDTNAAVSNFKNSNGLTFNMAGAGSELITYFGMVGEVSVPRTLLIDRYGVVVFDFTGSMTSMSDWTVRFDKFVGEDYEPYIWANAEALPDDVDPPEPGQEQVKPNVDIPKISDLKEAFDEAGDFSFRWQDKGVEEGDPDYDEYNWPWTIEDDEGGKYLQASNRNINNSWAMFHADFKAAEGDVIAFEYQIGAELDVTIGDFFYLLLDGAKIKQISGYHLDGWTTCYAYVFKGYEEGEHSLTFVFQKDGSVADYDDIVRLRNLRVLDIDDIPANAGSDAFVFRDAANVLNTDENATTQYKQYANVVYNEEDGYYHVDTKDGPLLLANLWYTSKWSQTSLWVLAYNDYCIVDGLNLRSSVEDLAWGANQPTGRLWGYTTVTQEVKEILQLITRNVTDYQKWNGPSHDKEWLELCSYYENYGDEAFEDPMRGITYAGAIEMHVGDDNRVDVLFEMLPRGFKYKFIPEESGVYHVFSTGMEDTICWLANENGVIIGEYSYKYFSNTQIINGQEYPDYNFEFYWNMKAGTTYYFLLTNYDDSPATYYVTIERVADDFQQFTPMATEYSQNMTTNELFVMDAMDYTYNADDGYYHVKNADGSMGNVIYLNTHYTSYLDPNYSLAYLIASMKKYEEGVWTGEWDRPAKERPFYANGVDYTEIINAACDAADENEGELNGFVALDQDLFKAISNVTQYSEHYNGIENSWQMMCYYYKSI